MPGPRSSRRRRNGRLFSGVFHIVVNCGFCEREVVRCIESLRMQIAQESLGRNLTVGELLEKTGGNDTLVKEWSLTLSGNSEFW